MDSKTAINDILVKAITEESLDAGEQAILDAWLADKENHDLFLKWKSEDYSRQKLKEIHEIDSLTLKNLIDQKINTPGKVIFLRRNWIQYAAAAILFIAGTAYFLVHKQKQAIVPGSDSTNLPVAQNDVKPGSSKAVLTLADGRKIVLDSAGTGKLADQGNAVITNSKGQLVYKAINQPASEVQYNTLTTARGEIYSIQLSDGTVVTLNSESSVRYPLVFTGATERRVVISGEAFFDVSHNPTKPFIVSNLTNNVEVKVYGTEFNVNTYAGEQAKITLVKGSVKVSLGIDNSSQNSLFIKPGQQASVINDNHLRITSKVNLEEVLAWKNGRFYFDNADIELVMHQLERWYNIEVVYEGPKPKQLFAGGLERSLNLSQVIKILTHTTGVHFRLDGRRLFVTE